MERKSITVPIKSSVLSRSQYGLQGSSLIPVLTPFYHFIHYKYLYLSRREIEMAKPAAIAI